jgi:hypothetical protein
MIDMAVRLGLNFQDGWHYPLTIRFVDGMAYGSENILASVELASDEINGAQQFLNINLTAYAKENFNFKSVFAHELVHAMLTDEIGPDASYSLPVWFHEGIAVYGAEGGGRDISKRETMSKAVTELADIAIVTLSDPFDADPEEINKDIVKWLVKFGFKYEEPNKNIWDYVDRREAVKKAVDIALPGDVILFASKGAEQSIVFKDHVESWDDREEVRKAIKAK